MRMLRLLKEIYVRACRFLSGGRYPGTPPGDPYAEVGAPLRRAPNDRSTAVALLEPDDD
jgi:hypothetical protein